MVWNVLHQTKCNAQTYLKKVGALKWKHNTKKTKSITHLMANTTKKWEGWENENLPFGFGDPHGAINGSTNHLNTSMARFFFWYGHQCSCKYKGNDNAVDMWGDQCNEGKRTTWWQGVRDQCQSIRPKVNKRKPTRWVKKSYNNDHEDHSLEWRWRGWPQWSQSWVGMGSNQSMVMTTKGNAKTEIMRRRLTIRSGDG